MKTIEEFNDQEQETKSGGIGLADMVRMLFKHKWKLIICALLGFGAAAAVFFTHKPVYESTSEIFIRYVPLDSPLDGVNAPRRALSADSMVNAEMAILRSWDLARGAVDIVTPEVILRHQPEISRELAAKAIVEGLEVTGTRNSQVISVTYRHVEPEVAVKTLDTLIQLYREKHLQVHRSERALEIARNRRNEILSEIRRLTDEIEKAKGEHGISSLIDAAAGLNKRSDEIRTEVARGEMEFKEQEARIAELKRLGLVKDAAEKGNEPEAGAAPAAIAKPDAAVHLEYQSVLKELTRLQDEKIALLRAHSANSTPVKEIMRQVAEVEARRTKLEQENPALFSTGPAFTPGAAVPSSLDPVVETVRLATLKTRYQLLQKREAAIGEELKQFAVASRRIYALERERDAQSENLKKLSPTLDFDTRIAAQDSDTMSVVQTSSPPILATSKLMKIMAGLSFGGLALGLGLVALLEFGFNRGINRPLELESRAGIPLMMNIPHMPAKALPGPKSKKGELILPDVEAWAGGHFIRPYAEAIRDRLVLHFEQVGLTRKPKLVAVASYSRGAGVSTVAGGIASALSEVGDGKVLLVDMNAAHAEVHPFFAGKPAASLTDALEGADKVESAADNLYLATAVQGSGAINGQLFPKRFYDMLPNFQASDFDYIIFDMPPMDESSLTLAMSGFMDKTLLVVEAEKDNRDAIRRAGAELVRARAKLSGVLNKSRSYGPRWLQEA